MTCDHLKFTAVFAEQLNVTISNNPHSELSKSYNPNIINSQEFKKCYDCHEKRNQCSRGKYQPEISTKR